MKKLIISAACFLLAFSLAARSSGQSSSHTIKIRFESSPIGASVYLDGRQLGVCPFVENTTLTYDELRDASKSTGTFTARWKSGATKEKSIRLHAGRSSQSIVFSRPYNPPDWSTDLEFAAELEKRIRASNQINPSDINFGPPATHPAPSSITGKSIEQQRLDLERARAKAEAEIQQQRLDLDRAKAAAEIKIEQERLELQRQHAQSASFLQQERLREEKRQAREAEKQREAEQTQEAFYRLNDNLLHISDQIQRNTERRSNMPIRQWGQGTGYQP